MTTYKHTISVPDTRPKHPIIEYDGAILRAENMLGKKLTQARKSKKMSQKELSKNLLEYNIKVSAGAISKWEKGDSMPNPYQLFAVCFILQIDDVLNYFTGNVPSYDYSPDLSQKGLNLLQLFKEALVSSGQYSPRNKRNKFLESEEEIEMKVFTQPAAAGPGNPILDGDYDMISFPVSTIPEGANFGIRVSGQSMLPRYVDSQIVWVEQCNELYHGDIGVFYYDDNAYIKKYIIEQPNENKIYSSTNCEERITPKITLFSLNRECANQDVHILPEHPFYIVGRVLN
ncbi:MAG: S24 family peptidase [Lachnospiraceae bacterium]|nr:S24 family peptidase [Lachnospiraceae bacterium]